MEDVLLLYLSKMKQRIRARLPDRIRKNKLARSLFFLLRRFVFALLLFRASFIPKHLTGRGSLMDVVQNLHRINWSDQSTLNRKQLPLVAMRMLEHRNYEYERRILDTNPEFGSNQDNIPIEKYCPYFFRNKELVLSLIAELKLDVEPKLVKTLAAKKHYYMSTCYKPGHQVLAKVNLFYAYRHLALKTYHCGEGYLIPTLAHKMNEIQNQLHPYLPAPSKNLKKALDLIGVDLPDVKLLSPDWSALIGHNGHLNVHLMMRKMGWWQGSPVLLAYKERIANPPFLSLFNEICPTLTLEDNVSSAVWFELASLTPFLGVSHQLFRFDDSRAMYWNDAGAMALHEWEAQDRGFPLRDIYDQRFISHEVNDTHTALLKKWGMKPSDWYVCLHMRDAQTRGDTEGLGESIRNTAFENYIEAIRYITGQGGWVIRMGGSKAPKLPEMPRVIDYAHSPDRSAHMDLHLVRKARLFIGTTSGFAYVASSFGIPTAMVNAISSIGLLWSQDTRFALKPIQTKEGRLLSQQEVISEKWRWAYPTHESLAAAGLSVRENTPDEILETVKEVFELTSQNTSSSNLSLLDEWKSSMKTAPCFYGSSLPSHYFLKKYADSFLIKNYREA